MLFNSFLFLLFFAVVYVVYWLLPSRFRASVLIIASVVFYATWGLNREGWWGIRWTAHFIGLVLFNYLMVEWMLRHHSRRKLILTLTVVLNLINLAVFKYFGFFVQMAGDMGMDLPPFVENLDLFLPLAISFYTFQLTAYVVDVYRGVIDEEISFSRFFLFILFFPQLIAGPIMRSTDFLPQTHFVNKERIYRGCWLFIGGLIKKVLLADPMGSILAPVYAAPELYTGWSIMLAGMCFSLQVYCDFSGYTDMARGSALLLGYDIPENFTAPFFSASARELWQRWHITLATWLRDYIYFPLGGSKVSAGRTYINQIITFTLGGFWHGADYTYICWGAMWGVLLALERFLEQVIGIKTTPEKNGPLRIIKIFFMFVLFSMGALMFRAQPVQYKDLKVSSTEIMGEMLSGVFTHGAHHLESYFETNGGDTGEMEAVFGPDVFRSAEIGQLDTIALMFLALFFFHWLQYRPQHFQRFRKYDFWLILGLGTLLGGWMLPALSQSGHQFIYFVF
ncbi:MAG: MBOAT family protein [Leptospiraceae bacterium]|nr:MBOAT family protein [Leptospiraceae bacterium]